MATLMSNLTTEELAQEINRLRNSPAVALAVQEMELRERMSRELDHLKRLEKRGKELMELGISAYDLCDPCDEC